MARSSPSTGLALLLLAAVVCASCLFQGAQATEYVPPKCSDAECAKKNTPCASYACGPDYKCSKVTYYPGKVCREAYGDCDVKEVCKDYDPYCPADEVKYKGHECRKAYGDCDVAEYCDGKNKTCPYDGVKDKTSKCRDSYGDCDEPEYCDGYSKKCPYDGVKNKTIKCRDSYGDCDEPEYCDGYSKECPYDGVKNKTIKCRDSYGDCDMPEYCDGKNKACPYDMKKPYGEVCRLAKNKCDEPEKCDGKSPYCPKDDSKSGGYVKKCGTTCFVCGKDNKITVTTETLPNGKTQTKYDVYGCNPGECKEIEYLDEYRCHIDCVTGKCENGKDVSNVIFLSCDPYGAYPKCNKIEGGGCRY